MTEHERIIAGLNEIARLWQALQDIAEGGGWQGRYAEQVLDAPQCVPPASPSGHLTPLPLMDYEQLAVALVRALNVEFGVKVNINAPVTPDRIMDLLRCAAQWRRMRRTDTAEPD